ncbi:MAG: polyphosphate kinase 2 family protein [Gemmatimonadota bacterium]|nr:polyphosphate kinase 2 family protein [Gemmatimonadota bacterium]MDH3428214.1 polyphosphate kinase 2 family protein [Gemmatimonadota bacterium]
MFETADSPYRVPFDGSFRVGGAPTTRPDGAPDKQASKKQLKRSVRRIDDLQRMLYAQDRIAVLLLFQAMDAAGKDSTIRAVMSGINPAGCQVFSFKQPSREELDHDYLWRTTGRLPERGRIGIFNRSYYEEVLVVRVHPGYLDAQRLPQRSDLDTLWPERYEAIAAHELHLARAGTLVLKFWLNVSREEQKRRFLSRIEEPSKNWKFSMADVEERQHWDAYMAAYEDALNATSRPWAPWYAIPADNKPFMRMAVADIIARNLEGLGLSYPQLDGEAASRLVTARERLEAEG